MRVVAGEYRGRRLETLRGTATRPTSERARAGLFDWLGPSVIEASVLDLFAGSGALGIEALSRGARCATFVERSRAAMLVLRRNIEALGLEDQSVLIARDVSRCLAQPPEERFDLVLADPPYTGEWADRLASDPRVLNFLAPGGTLIVERAARSEPIQPAPGLHRTGEKTYGETAFDRYEREEDTQS
jgi:16S rRNA (guanine966-N2)-methyltransferase